MPSLQLIAIIPSSSSYISFLLSSPFLIYSKYSPKLIFKSSTRDMSDPSKTMSVSPSLRAASILTARSCSSMSLAIGTIFLAKSPLVYAVD